MIYFPYSLLHLHVWLHICLILCIFYHLVEVIFSFSKKPFKSISLIWIKFNVTLVWRDIILEHGLELEHTKPVRFLSLFELVTFYQPIFYLVCIFLSKIVIFVLLNSIFPLFDVCMHLHDWGLCFTELTYPYGLTFHYPLQTNLSLFYPFYSLLQHIINSKRKTIMSLIWILG